MKNCTFGIIGNSQHIKKVISQVRLLQPGHETMLIEGETGTGKEPVARVMHQYRPNSPFIAIDCAMFTETIAAIELFGHCKGAFTNAYCDKTGLFEAANGGILFLDEIENLAKGIQSQLLRVLQEQEIIRVGETRVRKINVRVIGSTNIDLNRAMLKGDFRKDLYFRLSVITIKLPPLRDRIEDIPVLANHFLKQFSKDSNKPIAGIDDKVLECFKHYNWPGNVRELANVIRQMATFAKAGSIISKGLLPDEILYPQQNILEDRMSLKEKVALFEKQEIVRELERQEWNIKKTAETLCLSRRGLKQKMLRFGIIRHKK